MKTIQIGKNTVELSDTLVALLISTINSFHGYNITKLDDITITLALVATVTKELAEYEDDEFTTADVNALINALKPSEVAPCWESNREQDANGTVKLYPDGSVLDNAGDDMVWADVGYMLSRQTQDGCNYKELAEKVLEMKMPTEYPDDIEEHLDYLAEQELLKVQRDNQEQTFDLVKNIKSEGLTVAWGKYTIVEFLGSQGEGDNKTSLYRNTIDDLLAITTNATPAFEGDDGFQEEKNRITHEDALQIFCDRGNGLELDGCWGSEYAQYTDLDAAIDGAKHLAKEYPDCAWVVCDANKSKLHRIEATE